METKCFIRKDQLNKTLTRLKTLNGEGIPTNFEKVLL